MFAQGVTADRRELFQKEVGTPVPEETRSTWARTTFLSSSGVLWNMCYKSKHSRPPGVLAVWGGHSPGSRREGRRVATGFPHAPGHGRIITVSDRGKPSVRCDH